MIAVSVCFEGCFGWFHAAPGGRGVILCSALGHEELSAHRAWRGLAQQTAAMGLPTLRFDYLGTGDSLGDDQDPERVRAWIDSVRAAVRWMREEAGVSDVALAGLRFGATLATLAATELDDVAALALLAPAVSGRAYVRELKALARLAPPLPGGPSPSSAGKDGDLEVGGFVVTAETLRALGQIDLTKLDRPPAPRILILNRPDPFEKQLARRLRELGAAVQEAPFTGYASLMRDVNFAVPAHEAFGQVRDWMAADATTSSLRGGGRLQPASLSMPEAVEEPVQFGSEANLFGIVCRPTRPAADLPAALFINTGANHHVGPNRMTVVIARRLARIGVTSLRMDVAGIGESPAAPGQPDHRLYALESCEDVRAALDWLETEGHSRAIAIGLCCGAFIGFHTALRDSRICGLVMANLQRFHWHQGDTLEISLRRSFQSRRYYAAMARRPDTWHRLLSGRVNARGITLALLRRLRKRAQMHAEDWSGHLLRRPSPRQSVVDGFRALGARGVETLLVYSASDGGLDELEAYFGRDAKKLNRVQRTHLEILDGADHTFTARWARERFAARIEAHLDRLRDTREQASAAAPPASADAAKDDGHQTPAAHRRIA